MYESRPSAPASLWGKDKGERQIAIYLSKVLSGKKNIAIGKYFGIKDPAISGIMKAIEERLKQDQNLKKEAEHLKGILILIND